MTPLQEKLRRVFAAEAEIDHAALLAALDALPPPPGALPAPLSEAVYRVAHKLKGACRAVNLAPAQALGQQLEALFRHLNAHPGSLPTADFAVIRRAAALLGEITTAFSRDAAPPDAGPLLAELTAVLAAHGADAGPLPELPPPRAPAPAPEKPAIDPRLWKSFLAEAAELLETLHQSFRDLAAAPPAAVPTLVADAFRAAHTLKGSAHVVKRPDLAAAAHALEDRLRPLADTPAELPAHLPAAREALAPIDRLLRDLTGPISPSPASEQPTASDSAAFFRVDAAKLRQFEEAVSELLGFQPQTARLAEEAAAASAAALEAAREEETLRRGLASFLYRAAENPQHARAASYINFASRQLGAVTRSLTRFEQRLREVLTGLAHRLDQTDDQLHALQVAPAGEVLSGLRPMVEELGARFGKPVDFTWSGFELEMDRRALQKLRGALIHLLRNSLDHGIESPAQRAAAGKPARASLHLSLAFAGDGYDIRLRDDGRGISPTLVRDKARAHGLLAGDANPSDADALRLLFHPHFSTVETTTEVSGRGIGLSSVLQTVTDLDGSIEIDSQPGRGAEFRVHLPAARSGSRMLLAATAGATFGFPVTHVDRVRPVLRAEIITREGGAHLDTPDGPVPVHHLASLLDLPESAGRERWPALFLRHENGRAALLVDEIVDLRPVALRPLTPATAADEIWSGLIPLAEGGVALSLRIPALLARAGGGSAPPPPSVHPPDEVPRAQAPTVLVVDDSYTSRTLEASVVEAAGYRVLQAADGLDGLKVLRNEAVDLIVCDIEMPRLDGFGMLAEVKAHPRWREIPFILISSLEDPGIIQKGLHLGADSYIVKRRFERDELVEVLSHYL